MITEEQATKNMQELLWPHIQLMKEKGMTPDAIKKRVFQPEFQNFIALQANFEVV